MQHGFTDFLDEQAKGLAELAENVRKSRVEAARKAALESAARIKALNGRVRQMARSGVRLTSISQDAAQRLIELQAEIVTHALDDAAKRIERMAYTENVRDLARMNAEVLQAARQRIVDDIARAIAILKGAAGDARKVAAAPRPVAAGGRRKAAPRKPGRRRATGGAKAKAGPARTAKAKVKPAPRKAVAKHAVRRTSRSKGRTGGRTG